MEIDLIPEDEIEAVMFKIDLIVWKFFMSLTLTYLQNQV